jgi:hypothetical protein
MKGMNSILDIKQLYFDGCKDIGLNTSDEQIQNFIKYKEV